MNDNPDDAKALYFAGWILRSQGHIGMALQMFRRALAFEQKVPNIWMHYAACLHDVHKYDEAREAFLMVAKVLPKDPSPPANVAASYVQEGKAALAVEWADKALALDEKNRIARVAKAFGCLALGRWADGWEHAEYLYGESVPIRVYRDPEHEEPIWDGSKGKTVVLQADQGLGDVIMFSQCIPQMVKDCKKVILDCDPRLVNLFKRNFPEIDVYGTMKEERTLLWPLKYEIDAHVHISWLGKYYRTKDEDFPREPYLQADPEKRKLWRKWLEQFPRPWVGITWKGGIQRTNEAARSLELAQLEPLLRTGGTFISLAYQDVRAEVARWNIANDTQIVVPGIDNDGDYDEWLALIAELDHVVTTTTTVVHACGAFGKRAYVLVNRNPQWRYCYGGNSLMWYPERTLSLYRQKGGEQDWTHAIARLVRDYQTFVLPLAA